MGFDSWKFHTFKFFTQIGLYELSNLKNLREKSMESCNYTIPVDWMNDWMTNRKFYPNIFVYKMLSKSGALRSHLTRLISYGNWRPEVSTVTLVKFTITISVRVPLASLTPFSLTVSKIWFSSCGRSLHLRQVFVSDFRRVHLNFLLHVILLFCC